MKFSVGEGVSCNLETLINTRLLVQANSGAGKSWALRRLLEQTHGSVQHLVIDPEGEFASLRAKFDYVLAARSGGDTGADPRSAKLLAERLLELGVSAILDIYELKPHERVRFVRVFCEALVEAPKALWHPVLVVLDEAHVYCPEQGDAESADAVKGLATRGRKRGFCLVLATQRLSKLHKDAAAECNNKLIGRSSLDVDMKRASDELGFTSKDQKLALRDLKAGEFLAFGPALTSTVTKVLVGPVSTEHPKAGSHLAGVVPAPSKKVLAVLSKLADLPAEAEAREKSIEDLKKDNAHLRRQVTEAQKAQSQRPAPPVEIREVSILTTEDRALLKSMETYGADLASAMKRAVEHYGTLSDAVQALTARLAKTPAMPPVPKSFGNYQSPDRAAVPARRVNGSGEKLTGPEQRILDAIAWLESIGVDEPEQTAVAFLAGYTYGGGAFNNPRGRLNQTGYVEYRGDNIRLTDEGRALANAPNVPLTSEGLQEMVLNRLDGPQRRILKPLLEAYPKMLSDEALADAANYAAGAGSFNNPKGRLRSLGLIEYPQPRHAKARSILFLEA